jgi:DedD protein
MALLSIFKRKDTPNSRQAEPVDVAQARARSRRRMIGAAVLLAIGVIAFPLLFETQPRPIPVDIPIEIPRKEGQPPLVAPPKAPRMSSGRVIEPTAPVAVSEPVQAPEPKPEQKPEPKPAAKPEPKPAPRVEPKPAPPAPKEAKPAATEKPAAAAPAPKTEAADAANARFVVQVGAFADATAARDVRLRIEKMGLKTYTQIVQTEQGRRTRVRLGPFATQDEANRTLSRLKSAGLPGAVITL